MQRELASQGWDRVDTENLQTPAIFLKKANPSENGPFVGVGLVRIYFHLFLILRTFTLLETTHCYSL